MKLRYFAAVAVLAVLPAAACSSSSSSSTAAAASASASAAARASGAPTATSGAESFALSSTSTSAYADIDVAATGVFTAVGTIKGKSTANDAPLYATFPHGGFTIITTSDGHQTQSGNAKTCVYTFGMTDGKFRLEDGTGVYKGISGTGTVNLTGKATGPRLADGKCNTANNAQPVSMTQTGHATAQLKF